MEEIYLVKDLLQENNSLIKIDLKDAYSGIPLGLTSMGAELIRIPLLMF